MRLRIIAVRALIRVGMWSADDAKMDDTPVPETLQTIAASIAALRKSMDQRFDETSAQVGGQIEALRKSMDQRFEETNAQLGVKIEAVDAKVLLVFDAVIAMRELAETNTKDHQGFTERLENHDLRILALEPPKTATG